MDPIASRHPEGASPIPLLLIAVCLFALLKLFVIDTLRIEGHSMEPGLKPGRLVFVNRCAYGMILPFTDTYCIGWSAPKRNEIVVIRLPADGRKIVKRCVAAAGDRVRIENGVLTVGPENTAAYDVGSTPFFRVFEETIVPERSILVLGDNLSDSIDSRSFGFVPVRTILGRVVF